MRVAATAAVEGTAAAAAGATDAATEVAERPVERQIKQQKGGRPPSLVSQSERWQLPFSSDVRLKPDTTDDESGLKPDATETYAHPLVVPQFAHL